MKYIHDVVVVGAGIYGSAISFFLSKKGLKTLLVEKCTPGANGASRYSGGLVRLFDQDPLLTKYNYFGREDFINWDKLNFIGKTPYHKTGLLYLLQENMLESALQELNKWKINDGAVLNKNEYSNKFPYLKNHPATYALFEKDSGYADVRKTIYNLIEGFKQYDGTLIENCEISGLDKGAVWELHASIGKIYAHTVVFATGAYSSTLFPDLELKVKSIPLTLVEDINTNFNIPLIDGIHNTYVRPLSNNQFYCGSQHIQEVHTPEEISPFGDKELGDTIERINKLSEKDFSKQAIIGFNGIDGYTKTNRPIIGFDKNSEGIYHATGFSGRGFKCSLALSKSIANEIITYLNKSHTYSDSISFNN